MMVKKFLALLAVVTIVSGCATGGQSVQISKPTDGKLTCDEILSEIEEMNILIEEIKKESAKAHIAGAGSGIAGHAVSLGGLPIVGAVIGHAGGLANMNAAEREELKKDAEMRISALNGIYIGKDCNGEVDAEVIK